MTHLVTGAKGFLGSHLMRALGKDAVGLDLPKCDILQEESVPDSGGYCHEPSPMWLIFSEQHPETVWHLAALNSSTAGFYERPWDVLNTQIRGTLNVIDACVANGVKTLVLFSSSEVFQEAQAPTPEAVPFSIPDPTNPRYAYAGGKQASELLAWWSPIPKVVVIRPFNVFGEGQKPGHVIPDLEAAIRDLPESGGTLHVKGHPEDTRAYCHVSDFIAGCLRIVEHHEKDATCREVYNIGNPDNWMNNQELAARLLERAGKGATVTFGGRMPGAPRHRCPDMSKLQAIGWEPKVLL